MTSLIEDCLGQNVERLVITSGHYIDEKLPMNEWPHRYFVERAAADGDLILWDGSTYEQAQNAARRISRDWGNLPIIDRTEGGFL